MAFSDAWLTEVLAKPGYTVVGDAPRRQAFSLPAALVETADHPPYWPYRSQLEYDYAEVLTTWQTQGLIRQWQYESHRLTLAPKTTLTVDFYLWMADGSHQLHDTKGHTLYTRTKQQKVVNTEDGWQKLKQAAAKFPGYRFFRVQRTDQQWQWQEVPAA